MRVSQDETKKKTFTGYIDEIWKDLIDCGLIDKKVIENMEDQ